MTELTITEFLLALIAEDKEIALAATPGPWKWDNDEFTDAKPRACQHATEWTDHGPNLVTAAGQTRRSRGEEWWEPSDYVISATGYDASSVDVSSADAAHIARHDPARVLAECEAKRRIVRLHEYDFEMPIGGEYSWEEEVRCKADHEEWPCVTLRLYALPHADHPGYREEWKP